MNRSNISIGRQHRSGYVVDRSLPTGGIGVGQDQPGASVHHGIDCDCAKRVILDRGSASTAFRWLRRPDEDECLTRLKIRSGDCRPGRGVVGDAMDLTDNEGSRKGSRSLVDVYWSDATDCANAGIVERRRGQHVTNVEEIKDPTCQRAW